MEADAAAKVEDVGERVRSIPGFGEVAVEIHLVVAFEEAAEEQAVNVLGLSVGSEAGVEIGGVGFNNECEGRRIGGRGAGAGNERKRSKNAKK